MLFRSEFLTLSGADPALQARYGHKDIGVFRRRLERQPFQFPPASKMESRLLLGYGEVGEGPPVVRIEPDGPSQQVPALHGRPGELSAQAQRLNLVRIKSQSLESLFTKLGLSLLLVFNATKMRAISGK